MDLPWVNLPSHNVFLSKLKLELSNTELNALLLVLAHCSIKIGGMFTSQSILQEPKSALVAHDLLIQRAVARQRVRRPAAIACRACTRPELTKVAVGGLLEDSTPLEGL
jgi:hypothetical protein